MLSGVVASGDKPHCSSGESNDGAYPERRTPAVMNHDVGDEQRRESGARTYTGKDPAVRDATLGGRNPARNKLIGGFIFNGSATTEKKTDADEKQKSAGDIRGDHGRKRGKNSPPYDARGQHAARPE